MAELALVEDSLVEPPESELLEPSDPEDPVASEEPFELAVLDAGVEVEPLRESVR